MTRQGCLCIKPLPASKVSIIYRVTLGLAFYKPSQGQLRAPRRLQCLGIAP